MGIDQLSERCMGCNTIKPWGKRCTNCMAKASAVAVVERAQLHAAGVAAAEGVGYEYETPRVSAQRHAAQQGIVSQLAGLGGVAAPPPSKGMVVLPDGTSRVYDMPRAIEYAELLQSQYRLNTKDALLLARWAASMPVGALQQTHTPEHRAWTEAFRAARTRADEPIAPAKAAWDQAFDAEMAETQRRRHMLRSRLVR